MIWKYLSLMATFFRTSLIADFEYRMNVLMKFVTDIFWYLAQLILFEFLFRHVTNISGWTLDSVRVFMGLLFLVDGLWMILFSENLDRLSEKVRRGDLDLMLTKPLNTQFMLSLQKFNTPYVFNVLLSIGWLSWALSRLPESIPFSRFLILFASVPLSLIICYCMRMFFSANAFIFTRVESLTYVWYQIYKMGTKPDGVYPNWMRYTILSVLPVGFIASVPARMILNGIDWPLMLAMFAITLVMAVLCRKFWNFAIRHYTSASS